MNYPAKYLAKMSLSTRVLIFFSACPDETLTTGDIGAKFDCAQDRVSETLRGMLNAGLLKRVSVGRGAGNYSVYGAGHRLLAEIGHKQMAAA